MIRACFAFIQCIELDQSPNGTRHHNTSTHHATQHEDRTEDHQDRANSDDSRGQQSHGGDAQGAYRELEQALGPSTTYASEQNWG